MFHILQNLVVATKSNFVRAEVADTIRRCRNLTMIHYDFDSMGCPVSDLFCKPHQACGIPLGGLEETAFHFSNLSNLSNAEIRSAHPCFLAALPCLSRGRFATHPVFFCFLVPRLLQKLPGSLARQSRPDVPSWLVQQRRCFLRWLLYWLWVLFLYRAMCSMACWDMILWYSLYIGFLT